MMFVIMSLYVSTEADWGIQGGNGGADGCRFCRGPVIFTG